MTTTAAAVDATHPHGVLDSVRALRFVCPICRGQLTATAGGYGCPGCERTYPVHGGIPDFRVFPDPYLDFDEDRARTEKVLAALDAYPDLESLLHYYWSLSDITPVPLRAKYVRSAMLGDGRARRVLRVLDDGTFAHRPAGARVLEVGSGTGNFLAAARYAQVVGTDIGMRWLHVSRRRFADLGLPVPPLVCCCAEHLPFAAGSFDLVVCSSTLEFTREPRRAVAEAARVVSPAGSVYVGTANRYSVAVDPYVYLWGVGFLPRKWQAGYVRRRRGASYQHVRPLSYWELTRLGGDHFGRVEVALPDLDDETLARLPAVTRLQVRAYRILRGTPEARSLLKRFGPQWDVLLSGKLAGEGHGRR